MRIDVQDAGNHFADQTRAYAEYRVFSALTNVADIVQHAVVTLMRSQQKAAVERGNRATACSLSIRLRSGGQVDLTAHGQHPYDAIDRVARRVAAAVAPHVRAVESTAAGP